MDTRGAVLESEGPVRGRMKMEGGRLESEGRAGKVEGEANENGGRHFGK